MLLFSRSGCARGPGAAADLVPDGTVGLAYLGAGVAVMIPSDFISDESPALLDALVENHRAFLRYLARRVGDRELAEDILQDAFIKVMDRPDQSPAGEGLIPWFYRTLRNAAIDRFRRREAASRAVESFARELETHAAPAPEMEGPSPNSAAFPRVMPVCASSVLARR
jgi:predicted RNA polymerase sigma factor